VFVSEDSRAQHRRDSIALVKEGLLQEYGCTLRQAKAIMTNVLGQAPTSITAGEVNKLHQAGQVAQLLISKGMDEVQAFKFGDAIAQQKLDVLKDLVNGLPNTQGSLDTMRAIEDALVAKASAGDLNPPILTKGVHEVFFKKKTEALEAIISDKVSKSNKPEHSELQRLPKEQYWKTMIDGSVHDKNNKHFYDRSKGFMGSMMRGLDKIVSEPGKPLSKEFVKELHQCATEHVTSEENVPDGFPMQQHNFQETGLKRTPNSWGVCKDFSEQGMKELQAIRKELDDLIPGGFYSEDNMRFDNNPDRVVQWKAGKSVGEALQKDVDKLMDHVIKKGETEIRNAKGDKDKVIGAIVDTCRGLGVIHPFKDANGRLMMFMVLNKMLMDNGMSPTILQNQGHMVGKSRDELVAIIKAGQQKVQGMYV